MNKNCKKTTVIIIFTFSLFICFSCEIQQEAPASPSEILRTVYGDYFYEDLNGNYFSLGWPEVIDIGANNLDMTEKHGDIKNDDFKLSCDKPDYNYGETIRLSLSSQARGSFCWEYNIEQNINGRWYLLNALAGWSATLYPLETGDVISIEVSPYCGWEKDGEFQYLLEPGIYRIVVPIRLNDENVIYSSCDIIVK